MVKPVSKTYLSEAKNTISRVKGQGYFKELMDRRIGVFDNSGASVYFAYDPKDEEYLLSVMLLLDSTGAKIYPDWSAYSISSDQESVNPETIRSNIERCSKFIFIATENAVQSSRCNWELGIGYGLKYPDNIAVMSVTEQRGTIWSGPDHLQTFPMLVTDNDFFIGEFFIEGGQRRISLTEWLREK